jgi:Tfp pilus assembly protein PilF
MNSDLIEKAMAALRGEQYAKAVAIADQLAVDMPENALVRAIRAQGLLYSNDPEGALADAKKAVELEPSNAHSRLLLGYSAWRTERLTLAQESFEAAIRLSERGVFFLAEYAWFLANQRTPKMGETAARDALEADAESSIAWAALGLAQLRMHRLADAEKSLRRALELNPNDIYAQSAMIALLKEQGKNEQAQALVDRLAEHSGTEEFVDSLRDDAKNRKLAALLIERNIDFDPPPADNTVYFWVAVIAVCIGIGGVLYYLDPSRPMPALLFTLLPPLFVWVYLRWWN